MFPIEPSKKENAASRLFQQHNDGFNYQQD